VVRHSIVIGLLLSLVAVPVAFSGCAGLEVTASTAGNWTTFAIDNQPPGSVSTTVTQDDQGTIWVGTLDGLIRFDGNSWGLYTDAMQGLDILCAARDEQGNLWFGTWGQGVFEYTGTEWRNFTPDNTGDGLPGPGIKDIFVDNQGNLWFPPPETWGKGQLPLITALPATMGLIGRVFWTAPMLKRSFRTAMGICGSEPMSESSATMGRTGRHSRKKMGWRTITSLLSVKIIKGTYGLAPGPAALAVTTERIGGPSRLVMAW
jgi:hypothetical protein